MATNRIDILDQALLRPGRIDRKIEFPNPNEEVCDLHNMMYIFGISSCSHTLFSFLLLPENCLFAPGSFNQLEEEMCLTLG